MGSRHSFATPHSRVPSAMTGQYTLKPDTHSNRDTGPYAALTKSQPYKQAKHTQVYNFAERISFAEHWKLVAKSSELTLSRAHLERIFPNSKYAKKRDILSEKRGSGMALKTREFMPEIGNVDTYVWGTSKLRAVDGR